MYCLAEDSIDVVLGRRDEHTPPKRKSTIFVGGGDFRQTGEEFVRYFIELGGLEPDAKVLDVGSGIGRMALPLTTYLQGEGSYEGLDIVPEGIQWCTQNITRKYPNFHFQLADVYNNVYNPKGQYKASEYRFPYEDRMFDFIFLTSVFTHMLPQEMEHYIAEIARTLKNDGRCLITFFLLNAESLALIDAHASILDFLDFKYDHGVYRTIDKRAPESAIAYDEHFVRGLYAKYGLHIVEPIHYGAWCGRPHYLSGQDIIVATKNY